VTKPRQEDRACENLKACGVEAFTPKLKATRLGRTGARVSSTEPLFPRYAFARFALERLHQVIFTRGVQRVVSFGREPTPVEESVIELVLSRSGSEARVKTTVALRPGDRVVIKDGPLKDLVGTFEREMSAQDRVTVLLSTLSFHARLAVGRDQVCKVADMDPPSPDSIPGVALSRSSGLLA